LRKFKAHNGKVLGLAVLEDETKILSCGYDKAIVWTFEKKKKTNL
jgi:hypothetical protein